MLRKLQENFIKAITSEKDELLIDLVKDNGFDKAALIDVYRNNHLSFKIDALAATYPSVEKILGSKTFAAGAREYVKIYPSVSGNLDDYGGNFSDFLKISEVSEKFPFLPDLAKLEWLYHLSSIADEEEYLELDLLAGIDAEKLGNLKFKQSAAFKILKSEFPVADIWHSEKPLENLTPQQHIIIFRAEAKPAVQIVTPEKFRFLSALAAGKTMAEAFEETGDDNFNLLQALLNAIKRKAFIK